MSDGTGNNGFYLTLGAASKQTGIGKATLSRAIRDGKLSAQRCPETNSFKIDPAELQRFAEVVRIIRAEQPSTPDPPAETPLGTQLVRLEARCEVAEAKLALTERQLEDMRAERDRWANQAERLALPATRSRWWRWRRVG